MKKGRLVVVGTGIITPAHLSQESISHIKHADVVHVLVPDPLGLPTISDLNDNVKNLGKLYFDPKNLDKAKNRQEGYDNMVEAILDDVRKGLNVCAIFYGHPGVFVYPSHKSLKIAKQEGYAAKMLPAISAEGCLLADLGIDPGSDGYQGYEASQFLFFKKNLDTTCNIILWQIGVVGDETLTLFKPAKTGLAMLQEKLLQDYPAKHAMFLYESPILPIASPRMDKITLEQLPNAKINTITTLVIPPLHDMELDQAFCDKWEIDVSHLTTDNTVKQE